MGNTSNIKQLVLLDFEQRVGPFPEKKDGEPNHNDGPLKLPEHNASQSAKVRNNKFFVELRWSSIYINFIWGLFFRWPEILKKYIQPV